MRMMRSEKERQNIMINSKKSIQRSVRAVFLYSYLLHLSWAICVCKAFHYILFSNG